MSNKFFWKGCSLIVIIWIFIFSYMAVKTWNKDIFPPTPANITSVLSIAYNSYQTGCLNSAQMICSTFGESSRNYCFNNALSDCHSMALNYLKWLKDRKQ